MSWTNKTKVASDTWGLKTKISTMIDRGRILTHDNNQVLVGSLEDEVLVWQAASDTWIRKSKTTGVWENKIKIAA